MVARGFRLMFWRERRDKIYFQRFREPHRKCWVPCPNPVSCFAERRTDPGSEATGAGSHSLERLAGRLHLSIIPCSARGCSAPFWCGASHHGFHPLLALEFVMTIRSEKYENKWNLLLSTLRTAQQQLSQECLAYGVKILFVLF